MVEANRLAIQRALGADESGEAAEEHRRLKRLAYPDAPEEDLIVHQQPATP